MTGGAGILGSALIGSMPDDVLVINISRKNFLEEDRVVNISFDIRGDIQELVHEIDALVPNVDVLMNLAYSKTFSSVRDFSTDAFLDEIRVDVAAPVMLCRYFNTQFWGKASKEENISNRRKVINISSMASLGKTMRPELATYSATKSALNSITEYVHEFLWEASGVSAHIVAPAGIGRGESKRLGQTVSAIWKLQLEASEHYSITKIP